MAGESWHLEAERQRERRGCGCDIQGWSEAPAPEVLTGVRWGGDDQAQRCGEMDLSFPGEARLSAQLSPQKKAGSSSHCMALSSVFPPGQPLKDSVFYFFFSS